MSGRTRDQRERSMHWQRHVALTSWRTGDELDNRVQALELDLCGHECGHTFTITFTSVGHSGLAGEGPDSHIDADWASERREVTVRAHDLPTALRRAAALPLAAWFPDEDASR